MADDLLVVVITESDDASVCACEGVTVFAETVLPVDTALSSRPTVTVGVEAEDGNRDSEAFGVA